MICLAVAYLIIFIFLVLIYDFSKAVRIISPAIAGGIITVAAVSLLGFSLNFFGVLALVIVLGLAVDYAIFLSEAGDERSVSNIAITLSVFTTTGSFGLLMLSKTPVLAMFGAVISLGVIISWLLLPIAFQNNNTGS
jgi:predicted exporter